MKNITTIKERILQIAKYKGVSKSKFSSIIGISYTNFAPNKMISDVGVDVIVKIITDYPEINLEWLVLGKGEMIKTTPDSVSNEANIPTSTENENYLSLKEKYLEVLEKNFELQKKIDELKIVVRPKEKNNANCVEGLAGC